MLQPHAASEYDAVRTVALRHAGEFTRPLQGPDVHPVLARQMATSTWAPFDPAAVRTQQDTLIKVLTGRGAEVILLDPAPGCSCQHYTRDLGVVVDDVLVLARLNSAHRQPEQAALLRLAEQIANVAVLDAGTLEGGDVMLHTDAVLVGLSEETSPDGVDALRTALGRAGIERDVLPIEFATSGIVHLDDHFNIVAPNLALVHRTVFPAERLHWFEQNFDLIEVTDAEALAVQANVLAIAPGTVVLAHGSDRIAGELAARGIEVIAVDYSAVTTVPGSIRCSTLPLCRAATAGGKP